MEPEEQAKKAVRTAVVIVHGMGEQLPLDTLNGFVRTALPRVNGERVYFSRPERITDSYEARRHLAYLQRKPDGSGIVYGQTEFLEYHWSYLMTGNKLGDLLPTLRRLLWRKPSTVPYGIKVLWWIVWALIVLVLAVAVVIMSRGKTAVGLATLLVGQGIVVTIALQLFNRASNVVTRSFVDVVRYLDRSPRSYEVRRAIRKGMVDLLTALHAKKRYSRVIIVAHSLGAYIAYDAITYLWPQMCKLHCGPLSDGPVQRLAGLKDLEKAAVTVDAHPLTELTPEQQGELDDFRAKQFRLWQGMRQQGNPWLITDFISVGTPMYFADLLYTKNRQAFDTLVKKAELPVCPPRSETQTVDGPDKPAGNYGFNNLGREVLAHGAAFAVVRWTNLFFPAERSWNGDWFGGRLRPLFGKGVLDRPIEGNLPGRRTPGLAHSKYFSYPDDTGPLDVATQLRGFLQLDIHQELTALLSAPDYLEESDVTR